jgi:O-antigen ligase
MKTSMQAAIVAGLVVAALAVPIVGADVYDFFAGEQYTGRREIWQGAWNAASERPLLGTGIGNWFQVGPHYIQTPWLKHVGTHSVYLQNAVEMGFPSVVLLLVFFACFFYASLKIEQQLQTPYLVSMTRGAVAALLGIMVHGIFENGFLLTAFSAAEFTVILPYLFLAIPFAAKKLEEKRQNVR